MSLQEEVEHLRRIPLFSKVEPTRLKLLAFTSDRIEFDGGDVLFRQGDHGDSAYVILEGEVEVVMETDRGSEVLATIGESDIVGELAVLRSEPRTATVKATRPTVTLKVTKDTFFSLIEEFPEMAVETMRILADRLDRTTARLRMEIEKND